MAAAPTDGVTANVMERLVLAMPAARCAGSRPWSRSTPGSACLVMGIDLGQGLPVNRFKAGMFFRLRLLGREGHVAHPNWRMAWEAEHRGAPRAIADRKTGVPSSAAVARVPAPTGCGALQRPRHRPLIYRSRPAATPRCGVCQAGALGPILLTALVTKDQKSFPPAADNCSWRSQSHAVPSG